MDRLGAALAFLWVGGALAGWIPGWWVVASQSWWWGATSLVAISVCHLRLPRVGHVTEAGWALLGLIAVGAGWCWGMPDSLTWLAQAALWMLAGAALVERWGWTPLRRAVVWWAWLQVPVLVGQWCGLAWWNEDPQGTVGRRAVLAGLWAMASLWSSGWRAWGLAVMAVGTGSFTGLPALLRLLPINWVAPTTWTGLAGAGILTSRWWLTSLQTRWEVWTQTGFWTQHWLTGWGLQLLPVGFAERLQVGERMATSPALYLNSTWLDTLTRGGLVGLALLLAVMAWAAWRSVKTKTVWTWVFAVWVMTWQSVGAQPALMCVGLVWLASLVEPRRFDVRAV